MPFTLRKKVFVPMREKNKVYWIWFVRYNGNSEGPGSTAGEDNKIYRKQEARNDECQI